MEASAALVLPEYWKIGIVLGLLILAVVLFAIEIVSVDLLTLLLLLVLVGTQVLSVHDAFSGFSSEIIIILNGWPRRWRLFPSWSGLAR